MVKLFVWIKISTHFKIIFCNILRSCVHPRKGTIKITNCQNYVLEINRKMQLVRREDKTDGQEH